MVEHQPSKLVVRVRFPSPAPRLKRRGKLWIRIFPDLPVTKKPNEIRMGKGKGSVNDWVCRLKSGHVLYEIEGTSVSLANEALTNGLTKLPVKGKIIKLTKL